MPKGQEPQSGGESARDILAAYSASLPGILETIRGEVAPTEQANLAAAESVSPGYARLLTDLYTQYGPQLATALSGAERTSRLGSARADSDILTLLGPQIGEAYRTAEDALNPEVAGVRRQAAGQLGNLLSSINLDAPMTEAERLIGQEEARTGNAGIRSATGTVANALSFGNELASRRAQLGQAIGAATQFIPSATSQFNPLATAVTRGSNVTSQFPGVAQSSGAAYGIGGSHLSGVTGLTAQRNQALNDRPTTWDSFLEFQGSMPS